MALLFCDSFDHYTTVAQKWELTPYLAGITIGAWGRNGTNGLQLKATFGSSGIIGKSYVGAGLATWIVGCGFKPGASAGKLFVFNDSVGNADQVYLKWFPATGKIQVFRGDNTLLGTSIATLSQGVYVHIEFKVTISDAAGTFTLRVNGVTDVTASSVDTKNTANATADRIYLGPTDTDSTPTGEIDDLYIASTAGTVNNDFLGDVRIQALLPNANGNYSQFTGSDGNSVDNYLLVDENPPNEDTDYVETDVLNNIDTYGFANLPANVGTVKAVVALARARKDDAGARSIAMVVRQSATDNVGTTKPLSTSYVYESQIYETNPQTAVAWTPADVNTNAEFGVKVVV